MRAVAGALVLLLAGCATPPVDVIPLLRASPDPETRRFLDFYHGEQGDREGVAEVWAALREAGGAGITELYGYEDFPEYDAAFLYTAGGRHFVLYFHGECRDPEAGPAPVRRAEVGAEVMDRLRQRVAAEWPPEAARSSDSPMCDGTSALVYVLQGGAASHAIYYDPDTMFFHRHENVERFRRHFAVTSLRRAVQAALPLEFFPREEDPLSTGDEEEGTP